MENNFVLAVVVFVLGLLLTVGTIVFIVVAHLRTRDVLDGGQAAEHDDG